MNTSEKIQADPFNKVEVYPGVVSTLISHAKACNPNDPNGSRYALNEKAVLEYWKYATGEARRRVMERQAAWLNGQGCNHGQQQGGWKPYEDGSPHADRLWANVSTSPLPFDTLIKIADLLTLFSDSQLWKGVRSDPKL